MDEQVSLEMTSENSTSPKAIDPLTDPVRREGADAFQAGADKWDNPYRKQSHEHGLWKHGWKIARERADNPQVKHPL